MHIQNGTGGPVGFSTGAVASPATNFVNAATTYFTFAVPEAETTDIIFASLSADISAITATAQIADPAKCLVAGTVRMGFRQASGGDLAGTVITARFGVLKGLPQP